jgi:hypothetical protein
MVTCPLVPLKARNRIACEKDLWGIAIGSLVHLSKYSLSRYNETLSIRKTILMGDLVPERKLLGFVRPLSQSERFGFNPKDVKFDPIKTKLKQCHIIGPDFF